MMAVSALISDARSRRESYRLAADMAVKKVGARNAAIEAFTDLGGAGKSSSPFLGYSQINTAARQYQHYKDIPYTAIRPVACKIAGLPIHVGMARKRKEGAGGDKAGFQTKDGRAGGIPKWVKSATSESIEPLDNHSFLDDISDPNPLMTAWASMYCTVVSLYMTGLAHWWMAPDPDDGGTQFWYLPTTWVNPLPTDDSPFGEFKVRPPWYAGEGWTVPASDMVRFTVPDPANPLSIFAPLQSQAMAVDVDDMVQRAQHTSMRDGPRPQVVLTAGRLPDMPGMPGTGMRPVLTPEQRKQLVAAIKMAYAGPTKYGEPFIIDGLIENITPFGRTPAEMDFLGSSRLTKSRIMQGLGVNPIVAGEIEGANRASAVVADSYFYALVVNPLAVQMSQVMTNSIGPRYAGKKKKGGDGENGKAVSKAGSDEKLVIWIAPAEAEDPTLTLARVNIAVKVPGCMTKGELRRYVSTGVLKIEQKDDDEEPVAPPAPAGGPFGGSGGEAGEEGAAGGGQAGKPPGKPVGKPPGKEGKQPPEKQPKVAAKPQAAGKQPKKGGSDDGELATKSFDINVSRTLTGQFADGGRTIAAEEILERVKRSPQNAAAGPPDGVTWEKWAELQGISGDFREWVLPTFALWELVKGGTLAIRTGMSEATVADKFSSGKRNPAIIVRTVSGNPPLAVVDGNHSLAASLRKWAVNPGGDGRDDVVKCLVSDAAASWMGLDLQKGEAAADAKSIAGLGVPGSPFDEWWIGGRDTAIQTATKHLPGRHDQLDHGRRGGVAAASRSQPSTADRSDTTDSFAMADDPSARPPTPSMLAPATRDIPSSSVLSNETARDGLNITRFVEVKEGEGDSTTTTKYAFKPADGESPYTLDQFRGRQCMCEVAASVVDDAMGLGLVAKTEMATLDGVKGSLQEYINDTAKTASELYGDPDPDDKAAVEAANERLRSVAGIDDMLYYDALIGNDDRHLKNWMVKDGQAKLIDNGRSFARNDQYDDFDRSWLRTMEHDPDYRAVRPMSEKFKSGLAGLLSEREAVDARLKAVGLEEENRAAFWKRAEHLRKIADGEEMLIFSEITLMEVARMAEGRKLL
jgi:phage portal protein BeeE